MSSEYHREYRKVNKERLAAQNRIRHEEWRQKLLSLVGDSVCKDCGHNDVRVLQFDHIHDNKIANVSAFIGRSWDKAVAEALKCDVVCANCHVIRTRSRLPALVLPEAKWTRLSKTHFPCGHLKDYKNSYLHKNRTTCLACRRIKGKMYAAARRQKKKELSL